MRQPVVPLTRARARAAALSWRMPSAGWLTLVAFLGAVLAFYVWTANTSTQPIHFSSNQPDHYNQLSDALLHGRASLLNPPPPGLLALKDPYDPVANAPFRAAGDHDLSLYHGRFYLDWGPTPALTLFIPFRVFQAGQLPESLAVVIYSFVGLLFALLLLRFLVRRYVPDTPKWMLGAGAVALAFGNAAPFLLRRPTVYEVAISAGYCFGVAGLYFLLTGALRERLSLVRLAVGSGCLGLAVGARPPYVLAGLATVVVFAYLLRRGQAPERRDRLRLGAAVLGPIVLAGVLLLIYNYVRFDSFTEFGQRYQLAGVEVSKKDAFNFAYLVPGFYYYLLAPVHWTLAFPYAFLPPPPTFPGSLPSGYDGVEMTGGVLANTPILLALVAAPFLWWRARGSGRELSMLVAGLAMLGLALMALIAFTLWGVTMRYEMDFASLLLIAGLVTWFALWLRSRGTAWWRRTAAGVGALLVAYGAVVGAAIGFTGYADSLRTLHPGTYQALERVFSPLPTLATMIVGHPVISRIDNATGYVPPHTSYTDFGPGGSTMALSLVSAKIQIISPDHRHAFLEAWLSPGPAAKPGSSVFLMASSSRSRASVRATGAHVKVPITLGRGLNEIVLHAGASKPPLLPPNPAAAQVLSVGRLVVK